MSCNHPGAEMQALNACLLMLPGVKWKGWVNHRARTKRRTVKAADLHRAKDIGPTLAPKRLQVKFGYGRQPNLLSSCHTGHLPFSEALMAAL